jgi:hypothetical protein
MLREVTVLVVKSPDRLASLQVVAGHRSLGELRSDARLPLRTRLRVILGLAVASWVLVGLVVYAAVEIVAR